MSNLKRATVYLDASLHRALRLKAAETDQSVSDLVNHAIRSSLLVELIKTQGESYLKIAEIRGLIITACHLPFHPCRTDFKILRLAFPAVVTGPLLLPWVV